LADLEQSGAAGAGTLSPPSRGGRLVVRAHNRVVRSPLRWLCGTRPVLALIHPFVEMTASDVLTVCHAVAARTDHWWVEGGWGVDALLGRQTRKHRDLDVCTGDDEREIAAVVAALRDLGLQVLNDRRSPAPAIPRMIWLADGDGHSVEVYPVNLDAPPFRVAEGDEPAFVTGIVGDEQVPCLAGWLHVKAKHRGYRWRSSDRHDLRMLDAPGAQPAGGGPTS
jgi:lincosamide nucleotidyltransferase A/C/D/E